MASIKGMLPSAVQVLRDGQQVMVQAPDLVAGDIVYISMGQKIPADMRLISCGGDLKFDRSVLTGEVCLTQKRDSLFFLTTLIQSEPVSGRVEKTDDNFLEVGK